eukprot:2409116-Prymnesium_polylepis.1
MQTGVSLQIANLKLSEAELCDVANRILRTEQNYRGRGQNAHSIGVPTELCKSVIAHASRPSRVHHLEVGLLRRRGGALDDEARQTSPPRSRPG